MQPKYPVTGVPHMPPQPTVTPYGHAGSGQQPPQKRRFLGFGIAYLAVLGLLYGLGAAAFTVLVFRKVDFGDLPMANDTVFSVFAVIGWAGLAYIITAGVLCIRGHPAGLWMGVVHLGGHLLLAVVGFALNPEGAPAGGCGAIIFLVLFIIGVRHLYQWHTVGHHNRAMYEHQMAAGYSQPAYDFAGQYGHPGPYGGPQAPGPYAPPPPGHYSGPATQPAAPRPPLKPRPAQPSAEHAFIELLGIAASIEEDKAEARLRRARVLGFKVLGEGHRAAVIALLKEPSLIGDLEGDIQATARRMQDHQHLTKLAPKAVAKILEDPNGVSPEAHELMNLVNTTFA